jgi:hypothetical protein
MPSPSLMDSVGHSGTQAPQAMQSSVIFMVMMLTPFVNLRTKDTPSVFACQMTIVLLLAGFVTKVDDFSLVHPSQ